MTYEKIYDRFLSSDTCNPNPCSNGGLCIEESDGTSTCTCLKEFYGDNCETATESCKSKVIRASFRSPINVFAYLHVFKRKLLMT